MELSFLGFLIYDFPSVLLVGGLIVLLLSNRGNKLPASFTLWIMAGIMVVSLFVEYLCAWAETDPSHESLRYWTTIVKYLIPPMILMMQILVLVKNKKMRILLIVPNVINVIAVTVGPYITGLEVLSYNRNYDFVGGQLRLVPFMVAFFYLVVLVITSISFFYDVAVSHNAIIVYLAVSTVIVCLLEFTGVIGGIVKYVQLVDIYLYYFFLNFVYAMRIREDNLQKELKLTQKELELSNTNVRVLQNQISPHFIYNALFIIKALIWTDQKKASDAVDDFSLYLRRNIDTMRSEKLITFKEELEHINAFLRIENSDDEAGTKVVFDTEETDFLLPPLTVEPLVENALIHGVGALESRGIIMISSSKQEEGYLITVEDNGNGFDVENTPEGVGLENIRIRLRHQCRGKLELTSRKGCTRACITIPYETPDREETNKA